MSKLTDTLAALSAFVTIWLAIVYHFIEFQIFNEYRFVVSMLPVILIITLGIYSAVVVLWRVFNFNDCHTEASELQTEIREARADLAAKGFVFQ